MIKQIIVIVLLSVAVVLTMSHTQTILEYIVSAHNWIANTLTEVFSGGSTGNLIRWLVQTAALAIVYKAATSAAV